MTPKRRWSSNSAMNASRMHHPTRSPLWYTSRKASCSGRLIAGCCRACRPSSCYAFLIGEMACYTDKNRDDSGLTKRRANVGNALVYGFREDIGVSGVQVSTSLTMFFITYILFEIPSNIALKKFTPRIWRMHSFFFLSSVTLWLFP